MNLPFIVVDASVAIKWLFPEEGFEQAKALRHSYRCIAPQIVYAECSTVIWKKARRSELTKNEALRATAFVETFSIEVISLKELVPLAVDLSLALDHAVYDCFYLALAAIQDCQLVTADTKLHRKVHDLLPPRIATKCMMLGAFPAATSDT